MSDLGEVFEFPKGGDTPICSQGSRWISHKCLALQRIIDRYGAYFSHHVNIGRYLCQGCPLERISYKMATG